VNINISLALDPVPNPIPAPPKGLPKPFFAETQRTHKKKVQQHNKMYTHLLSTTTPLKRKTKISKKNSGFTVTVTSVFTFLSCWQQPLAVQSQATYTLTTTGKCKNDKHNRVSISDKAQCGEAAKSLGLSETTALKHSSPTRPLGKFSQRTHP